MDDYYMIMCDIESDEKSRLMMAYYLEDDDDNNDDCFVENDDKWEEF